MSETNRGTLGGIGTKPGERIVFYQGEEVATIRVRLADVSRNREPHKVTPYVRLKYHVGEHEWVGECDATGDTYFSVHADMVAIFLGEKCDPDTRINVILTIAKPQSVYRTIAIDSGSTIVDVPAFAAAVMTYSGNNYEFLTADGKSLLSTPGCNAECELPRETAKVKVDVHKDDAWNRQPVRFRLAL